MIQISRLSSKKNYRIPMLFILLICSAYQNFALSAPSVKLNENKIQLSIMKGINYLINSANPKPEKDAVMLINFINHQYNLHLPYPTIDLTLNKICINSENIRILGKWYNPNFVLEKSAYEKNIHGVDSFMLASLYCNTYGLPNHYLSEVDSISKLGGYYLTHSCLQLQWSINNGCLNENDSTILALRKKLIKRLASLLAQQKEKIYDVGIEAIAVHDFMKITIPNKALWIKRVLASQLEDGGWAAFENDQNAYPHATALAIWVLTDWLLKDHPKQITPLQNISLSNSERYCSYNLTATIDSNIYLIPFDSLFSFQKTSKDSGIYTGLFLNFRTTKNELLNAYYNGVSPPTLASILSNTDSLAYLIEYKNHFSLGKSNELLDTLLSQVKSHKPTNYIDYLKTLATREILDKKSILATEKALLSRLKNEHPIVLTDFEKILETYIRNK